MTNTTTTTWTPAQAGLGRPRTTPTPRRLRRGVAIAALGALAAAGTALAAAVTLHDGDAPSVPAVETDGAVRPAASVGDRMSADALDRRTDGGAAGDASTCRSAPTSADSYERCLAAAGG